MQNPRSTMSESDSRQLTRDELTTMTARRSSRRAGRSTRGAERGEPGTPPPPPAEPAEEPSEPTGDWVAGEPAAEGTAVFRTVLPSNDTAITTGPLRLVPPDDDQDGRGQLTRLDLQTMTAEEIVAADRAGRLDDLKRSEADPAPG